ncbi:MAG: hypothetical protein R6V26_09695 [Roseovarius sp.]
MFSKIRSQDHDHPCHALSSLLASDALILGPADRAFERKKGHHGPAWAVVAIGSSPILTSISSVPTSNGGSPVGQDFAPSAQDRPASQGAHLIRALHRFSDVLNSATGCRRLHHRRIPRQARR